MSDMGGRQTGCCIVAQWMGCLPGVKEVMGSIPIGDSDFFCPLLVSCWLVHLHFSLPSLKFTIFVNLSLFTITSMVLVPAVCRTPVIHELSSMTLLFPSSHSLVYRAPAQCAGGHVLEATCWRLRISLCPTLMSGWLVGSLSH